MTQPCAEHPEAPAVAQCAACGRRCCVACRGIDEDGLSRCPACQLAGASAHHPDEVWPPSARPRDDSTPRGGSDARPESAPAPKDVAPQDAAPQDPVPPDETTVSHLMMPLEGVPAGPPIAWETNEGGDLRALRETIWDGLSRPVRYCARIPSAGGLYPPLVFALLCATFGHLANVGHRLFSSGTVVLPAYPGLTGETEIPRFIEGLLTAPLFPLMFVIMLFASAFLAHLLLDLVGATRRPFEATFRVIAYAHVGKVLMLVPILGGSVQVCYLVFLVLTGLRVAHGAGLGISALALLPVLAADLLLGMT